MSTPVGPYSPFYPLFGHNQTSPHQPQPSLNFHSHIYSSAHLQHQHPLTPPKNPYWNNPHRSSIDVLSSLLPHDPQGPLIYYFYVATQEGFSLILYHSKIQDSFMNSFLSGCDAIGARVDPVVMDTRYERIPPQLFAFLFQRMHRIEGLPPLVTFQGNWLSPDYQYTQHPSGAEIFRLMTGQSTEEQFPLFDLKLGPDTWRPVAHNPDLQGVSFAHAGKEELTVWLHESNAQALGSALKEAGKNSKKLKTEVTKQEKGIDFVQQFLEGKINEKKLLRELHNLKSHSELLIKAFRRSKQRDLLDQVLANAQEYLESLEREKQKVDRELGELKAYKAKLDEIQAAQGNPGEVQRLKIELTMLSCPASCRQSTAQIRKQKALALHERQFYLRKNLIDTLQLFKTYSHFLPDFIPAETSDWLARGKALLVQKATWIIHDHRSRVVIDPYSLKKDLQYHLGDLNAPKWKHFEWLFQRFAEYETNFQMMRITPFLDQDIIWLQEAVGILENHLQRSGRLTYELKTTRESLESQRALLQGNNPVFIVKRPGVGGEIQSAIVNRFGKDPLETQDGVHIPIGG